MFCLQWKHGVNDQGFERLTNQEYIRNRNGMFYQFGGDPGSRHAPLLRIGLIKEQHAQGPIRCSFEHAERMADQSTQGTFGDVLTDLQTHPGSSQVGTENPCFAQGALKRIKAGDSEDDM